VSFSVSVHRTPEETLFFAPVAGDRDLRQFWSVPASQLNLPLLAQIYDEGLQVSGADLGRLHDEIWTLEKRWTEVVFDDEIRTYDILGRTVVVPLLAHLSHRAESVLAAAELAQKIDGVLTIS
jgi:hypothetical protein